MNLIAALTDLVVGALIMPFNIEYHYYGDHWMASALMCRIWNFGDVTVSSASIWTLAAIAMDRWMVSTLGVKIRNLKMDFKTRGTLRWLGQ